MTTYFLKLLVVLLKSSLKVISFIIEVSKISECLSNNGTIHWVVWINPARVLT